MSKRFLFVSFFLLSTPGFCIELRQEVTEIQTKKLALLLEQKRLQEEAAVLGKKIEDLVIQKEKREKEALLHQNEISTNLPFLARLGRMSPLRILIDPMAGQNTLKGIILIRIFTRSLKHQIQRVQAELNEIEALSKDFEWKTQNHLHLLQTIEIQKSELKSLEIQKIEDWKQSEIDRLTGEEDVNVLLDEVRGVVSKAEKKANTAAALQGLPFRRLGLPVIGKVIEDSALQDKFAPHSQGIIFETRKNAEVVSPSQGRVVFKGPFQNQGEILIIDHGDKVHSVFIGMHKIDAQIGQTVYAGERLGMMAGYGSSPPKLYFELRQKGKAIDPKPFFADY
ncbi:MAG: peptidoglycan DD-metalloendopeptidase family protein [Alphaproteobacteria bacterium]|nr:peptidoglycan DD-metalloendopeptidase family protein [Alphaproteobacteria bacterium]